jgi:hypothetical protein
MSSPAWASAIDRTPNWLEQQGIRRHWLLRALLDQSRHPDPSDPLFGDLHEARINSHQVAADGSQCSWNRASPQRLSLQQAIGASERSDRCVTGLRVCGRREDPLLGGPRRRFAAARDPSQYARPGAPRAVTSRIGRRPRHRPAWNRPDCPSRPDRSYAPAPAAADCSLILAAPASLSTTRG